MLLHKKERLNSSFFKLRYLLIIEGKIIFVQTAECCNGQADWRCELMQQYGYPFCESEYGKEECPLTCKQCTGKYHVCIIMFVNYNFNK